MLIGIILILVVVALPVVVLFRRLGQGEQPAGGSMGRQLFGRDDDDWGPKPS